MTNASTKSGRLARTEMMASTTQWINWMTPRKGEIKVRGETAGEEWKEGLLLRRQSTVNASSRRPLAPTSRCHLMPWLQHLPQAESELDGWPVLRSEEAERSIAITSIKRRIVIATVKAQAGSLLGILQMIARGTSAAVAMLRNLTDNGRRKRKHLNWWLGKASAPSEWDLHFLTIPLL